MKISVVTPTYNRASLLKRLYNSLVENSEYEIEIEWLIMNDGSTDDTEKVVKEFIQKGEIEIKYFSQENKGKMAAINKLVENATGELIVDCDSDDYFIANAFETIKEEYEKNKKEKGIYGICFLKYDQDGENMGNRFKNNKTTMFDLYFKEGDTGEKAIVFYSKIRKQYKHELEHNEKFVTEARMYHKMDCKYNIICINKPIMICEYKEDGYSKNIVEQFKENPYGYYEYFKEILEKDMQGILFHKRIYAIKHYILFCYLSNQYNSRIIKNIINKILYYMLLVPGILKSAKFKEEKH